MRVSTLLRAGYLPCTAKKDTLAGKFEKFGLAAVPYE